MEKANTNETTLQYLAYKSKLKKRERMKYNVAIIYIV